ncbi:MAG: mycofactocin oligosaccharide methyltransferase MftM [Actinomycetales bacterium]
MTGTDAQVPPPIDPFTPVRNGRYRDRVLEVVGLDADRCADQETDARGCRELVHTPHFDVAEAGSRLVVRHRVPAALVDANLAGLVHQELFGPGWLRGASLLERIVTAVVLTSRDDPITGWECFYRNTLREIDRTNLARRAGLEPTGNIADFAPVYQHALALVDTSTALELGCSLGFLSLQLAAAGVLTTASDINPGTIALLSTVAGRLGLSLRTTCANAAHYPSADDGIADTVLVIHLLEHLDEPTGRRVLDEAIRLARTRVVVAVPLEDEPDDAWGHIRTFTLDDLTALGAGRGRDAQVHEHHGGWLVLDL